MAKGAATNIHAIYWSCPVSSASGDTSSSGTRLIELSGRSGFALAIRLDGRDHTVTHRPASRE